MPGIFGIIDYANRPDNTLFERLSSMISPVDAKIWKSTGNNILAGFKSVGIVDYPNQPFIDNENNLKLFVWGETFDRFADGNAFTRHIFHLYQENRFSELREINGFFSLALWDENKRTLILTSDLQGTRPLYYFQDDSRFIFGPNPFNLAALLNINKLDSGTLAEFLSFGIIFGDHTWIEGIRKLRYGQYLRQRDGQIEIEQYYRPEYKPEKLSIEDAAGFILEKLEKSVEKMAEGKTSLSLSGGSDSRLIAAILHKKGISVPAFTYGGPGSCDLEIAAKVSSHLNMRHYSLSIDRDYLENHIKEAAYNTAGHISALNYHGISTRLKVREFSDICLSGLCGNDLLGYLSFTILKFCFIKNRNKLPAALFEYFNHGFNREELKKLLVNYPDPEIPEDAIKKLSDYYSQNTALETLSAINHFELNGQNSQAGFWLENDTLEFRDPFSDHEIVNLNFRIPVRYKLVSKLARHLWKKYFPDIGKIEYQRTGLPLSTSLSGIILNRIGRKIRPQIHSPGIMDYSALFRNNQSWLREFLCTDTQYSNDFFKTEVIGKIIDDHAGNIRNNTEKIAILLTVRQVMNILAGKK